MFGMYSNLEFNRFGYMPSISPWGAYNYQNNNDFSGKSYSSGNGCKSYVPFSVNNDKKYSYRLNLSSNNYSLSSYSSYKPYFSDFANSYDLGVNTYSSLNFDYTPARLNLYSQQSFNNSYSLYSPWNNNYSFSYQSPDFGGLTFNSKSRCKADKGGGKVSLNNWSYTPKSVTPQSNQLKGVDINKFPKHLVAKANNLYKQMGLASKGLNYEVFVSAIVGYNNLPAKDKGNGFLGIFDTTQSADRERYYLIDLNNNRVVGQSVCKTGTGNMSDVKFANRGGSKATLSGFEKVGREYTSGKKWKLGINLHGLEQGINDNAYNKRTVAHYTTGRSTWGCKGISPVRNSNGSVNVSATYNKLRTLFPTDSVIFTAPTGTNYWQYSKLFS